MLNSEITTVYQAWHCPEVKALVRQLMSHTHKKGDGTVLAPFLAAQRAEEVTRGASRPTVRCHHCRVTLVCLAQHDTDTSGDMYDHPKNDCVLADTCLNIRYYADENYVGDEQ